MAALHHEINRLCAELGKDPLMVQGAGGNISYKESDVLWIKGSGTWLADADQDNIFVPVDLGKLSHHLVNNDFESSPELIGEHKLRPSIETTLHALMSQKVVVHLHSIEALTYLIHKDSQNIIGRLFNDSQNGQLQIAFVQYHKPGPQLAKAIQEALANNLKANIIFLKNHGIVIGADSADGIRVLLQNLQSICAGSTPAPCIPAHLPTVPNDLQERYIPFADIEVQALAFDPNLYSRLRYDWVLYPDHAVFLGKEAFIYPSWESFVSAMDSQPQSPELIFIENTGVFVKPNFNLAKIVQLRCYFDVISRVAPDARLEPLSSLEVEDLLNWDAEKLRQKIAK
jgi:rhamnose utilization protein RhaD (predicted bifunctional aldolase and dehydrogenase)